MSKYHEWMQDPTLLDATSSEPLTLQEEIQMQTSWREDDTKCTFIILAREELELVMMSSSSRSSTDVRSSSVDEEGDAVAAAAAAAAATAGSDLKSDYDVRKNDNANTSISIPPPPPRICQSTDDATTTTTTTTHEEKQRSYPLLIEQTLHAMIGDINLFLSEEEDDNNEEEEAVVWLNGSLPPLLAPPPPPPPPPPHSSQSAASSPSASSPQSSTTNRYSQAELDIMIASPRHRNKHLGMESTLMMMHYGASQLHIRRYFVKINGTNIPSLRLFQDKLGFDTVGYVECFGEYELECKCDTWEEMVDWVERRWKDKRRRKKREDERQDIGVGNACSIKKEESDIESGGGGGNDDDDEDANCTIYNIHSCPLR